MAYERSLAHTYLAHVPMFRSCDDEQLDFLMDHTTVVYAHDGDEVVRQGDAGDGFFVVTVGSLAVERDGEHVGDLGEGDFFGELALFDPAPRNATVRSRGDSSLLALTRDDFLAAVDRMPALRDALLHGMAHRLHELDARV